MSRFLFVTLFALLAVNAVNVNADDRTADSLDKLLKDHWAAANKEQLFFRKDPDTFRMNGRLPDVSAEGRARRAEFNQGMLQRANALDSKSLAAQQQVTLRLFKYERETEAESYTQLDRLYPLHYYSSFSSYFAGAPGNMSFLTLADYDNYLVSLADYPRYLDQYLVNLREAIGKGHVHYCESFEGYEKKISKHIVNTLEDSVFYAPFLAFPATIAKVDKNRILSRGSALISKTVIPQYQHFYDFFTKEYMPNCRKEVGITSLENGQEYYQYLIRYHTTTDYTADKIHQLGLDEVARIRAEMDALIKQIGFQGDFKAFVEFLRTDPQFYTTDVRDMIEKASYITRKMAAQLPKWFSRLPRNTFDIKSSPGGGAYYVASDGSGTTSGTYFLDTNDLSSQPLYNLEALTFHEAEPGHHFQGSIAMELDVPEFRKTLYHSAYGEGWGLYSERLGKEMGFYQDPYSDFGRLTYEMWRACRLVVDTGMHAKGWSRQQAIDYLADNTALSLADVVGQIDRYITWPAQALAYKIGELKIRELRALAEEELADDFDIRHFHDHMLSNGSLPLALLEELTLEWISDVKANLGAKEKGRL
ncbi:MAG: hypothetical protein ACJAQ6_000470 [Arenicella sp.]|jgi:uncharacterized protein (DUF885 family)